MTWGNEVDVVLLLLLLTVRSKSTGSGLLEQMVRDSWELLPGRVFTSTRTVINSLRQVAGKY